MMKQTRPGAQPQRHEFLMDSELGALVRQVMDAIIALPAYFRTTTHIEGLEAADLFSLNAVLGSTIEVQVVQTLNSTVGICSQRSESPAFGTP